MSEVAESTPLVISGPSTAPADQPKGSEPTPEPLPFRDPVAYAQKFLHLYYRTAAVSFGNVLEWYDYSLSGYLEPLLSAVFFSASDEEGWLFFAIPFMARLTGSIAMGWVANHYGRKLALNVSIWTMGLATFLQGFLMPGMFGTVGLLAALRLASGFAAGGEATSVLTYVSEVGEEDGGELLMAASGLVQATGSFAFLLATATALAIMWLPVEQQLEWGWRVPYLIAGPFAVLSIYLRQKVPETGAYERLHQRRSTAKMQRLTYGTLSLPSCLKEEEDIACDDLPSLVMMLFMLMATMSANYLPLLLVSWCRQFAGLTESASLGIALLGKLTCTLATFPVAFLTDQWGPTTGYLIGTGGLALFLVPLQMAVFQEATYFTSHRFCAVLLFGIFLPLFCTFAMMSGYILLTSSFPVHKRSQLVGIAQGLCSMGLGLMPLLWIMLSVYSPWYPGIAYSLLQAVGFLLAVLRRCLGLPVYQRSWLS